jgi:acyl-CoA synthetase (AMP-forming)/AMP-acid ligase II
MLTGSAPINPKVIELFGKVMGVPFIEAYGQTENTGGAFIQNLHEKEYGKIGHIWVFLLLFSQVYNSNLKTFLKWAILQMIKITKVDRLRVAKYASEEQELSWATTRPNSSQKRP